MATRKAVAASIAAAVLFSSLVVSNLVVFSGAEENFRLTSLATEESAYRVQAVVVAEISTLDLIDGAQALLSSRQIACSNSTASVSMLLGSERVRLRWGGISADSTISLAPDEEKPDNLTGLHPFNGSVAGMTNLRASVYIQGESPDGAVRYSRWEQHTLNIPVRLVALTGQCLAAAATVSDALAGLGAKLCNSSAVSAVMSWVTLEVAESAASMGFSLSVYYSIASASPCTVGYQVVAIQPNVEGPEGAFAFTEEEAGYLEA